MNNEKIFTDSNENIKKFIISLGCSVYLKYFIHHDEKSLISLLNSEKNDNMTQILEERIVRLKETLQKSSMDHDKELKENKISESQKIQKIEGKKDLEIFELKKDFENEKKNFKEKENNFEKKINCEIENVKKLYEKIISENEKKYSEKINSFHENEENKINYRISFVNSLHQKDLEKKDLEILNIQQNSKKDIDNLKEQLTIQKEINDKFIGKREFNNNTEKGDYGENIIDEVVNSGLECDKCADIDDSSREGGSGDRIVTFSNGLKLMIEVKNKGIIEKSDREQFEDHVKKDFELNKSNLALFVSLRTQQIPKIGNRPILHFRKNVGYYGLKDGRTKDEVVCRLNEIISEMYYKYEDLNSKNEKKDEKNMNNDKKDIYNQLLGNLFLQQNDIKQRIRKNDSEKNDLEEKLKKIINEINSLQTEILVKKIDVDDKYKNEEIYKTLIIKEIKEVIQKENIVLKRHNYKKIIKEKCINLTNYEINLLDRKNFIKLDEILS